MHISNAAKTVLSISKGQFCEQMWDIHKCLTISEPACRLSHSPCRYPEVKVRAVRRGALWLQGGILVQGDGSRLSTELIEVAATEVLCLLGQHREEAALRGRVLRRTSHASVQWVSCTTGAVQASRAVQERECCCP